VLSLPVDQNSEVEAIQRDVMKESLRQFVDMATNLWIPLKVGIYWAAA
jgi:hypothetical protein